MRASVSIHRATNRTGDGDGPFETADSFQSRFSGECTQICAAFGIDLWGSQPAAHFDLFGAADVDAEEYGGEIKKDPADEAESGESEVIDAEVIEKEKKDYQEQTLNNNGRIYQQKAEKIFNIEHIENFYG